MRHFIKLLAVISILLPLVAQAGPKLGKFVSQNAGKSIAVVSISANNWGDSLQGWNSADTTELMTSKLNQMLEVTESTLEKDFKVVKAKTFVAKPEFQALAGEQREVGLPVLDGKPMNLLSKDRKQLVKAQLDADVAKKLLAITGTDLVLIVYSEWAVKTGGFVPTSKALTKNVLGIYDKSGKQVFKDRLDKMGTTTLGAMGRVAVNKDTINEWVLSYQVALGEMYNAGKKKSK
ncbi:hypothetical protein P886_1466 [Alteromonadaceae bacterium 2753L.S.0a.02]|nr:hypothetical protein P886_1466 [Alteromonadaceae bacterium 2753L.S.0a.02]